MSDNAVATAALVNGNNVTIGPQRLLLLIGLLSGGSVVVLDFFIVLACLPSIGRTLGASNAQLQLVLAAYAMANASLLVVGGRLGDVFGRRRVLIAGMGLFAVATAACAFATSVVALILFRALQGMAGAMAQPQVLGLLSVNFESEQRVRVFGLYAAAMGFAALIAQLLGGVLVSHLSLENGWRACFLVSLPLCAMAMMFSASASDVSRSAARKVDFFGSVLLGVALACICAVLTLGREAGWPTWSFAVLGAGLLAALALWYWQRLGAASGAERIVPTGILQSHSFWLALLLILVFYAGVASFYFVFALELRVKDGFNPVQVGVFFAWMAAWFIGTSSSQRVKRLLGRRWAGVGINAVALGHVGLLLQLHSPTLTERIVALGASSALQGFGLGCLMGPLMANALARVRHDRASVGGGIAAATQQVGNSLGIAAIGLAYFHGDQIGDTSLPSAVAYLLSLLMLLALLMRAGIRSPH